MSLLLALQAPTDALAANAVGVGKATGALSVGHALAANSIGVGKATGALSVTHLLAGGAVGVGRAAGNLSLAHHLAGAAIGVGLASATLPSASAPAAPVVAARTPITAGGGGTQRRSAYNLGVVQPPRVIKVPDWLIDSYLRGEIDEEEFAVLVALQ